MLESSPGAGGYAVPTQLDPQWQLTGAGSVNPMRRLATIKRATTNNYHAISPAQITASWDTEGSAVSDDAPTFAGPSIRVFTARAYINASFEAYEDVVDLADQALKTFADAKNNLVASSFATGNGTSAPKGIITAIAAVAASRVSPTTGGTFALADVYLLQTRCLPAIRRTRTGWRR